MSTPFENIVVDDANTQKLPYYEANILTQLINSIGLEHSFNLFGEPGITDFFFTQVIPENDALENDEEIVEEPIIEEEKEEIIIEQEPKPLGAGTRTDGHPHEGVSFQQPPLSFALISCKCYFTPIVCIGLCGGAQTAWTRRKRVAQCHNAVRKTPVQANHSRHA